MTMSLATVSGCPDARLSPPRPPSRLRSLWSNLARRRGLRELLLIAVVYSMYDGSRFFVEGRQSTALAHAMGVLHVEQGLDMAWEQALNRVVSTHALLAVPADYMYATLHYLVTPIVLVWMWRAHRAAYSRARTTLMVATVIGLVGFSVLPVAPPRMLPGFIDTMAQYSGAGWWSTDASAPRGVGSFTNQFAAMPSLHVGGALWCGWQLVQHGKHLVTRVSGVLSPAMITVVVMATGNHYLLDAVAGVAVVVLAMAAVGVTVRLTVRLRPPRVIDLTAITPSSTAASTAAPTMTASIPSQGEPRG